MPFFVRHLLALSVVLSCGTAAQAKIADEQVARLDAGKVVVTWSDAAPVDVYASDRPDVAFTEARLIAHSNRKGRLETPADHRVYFVLRDAKDGTEVRVAERVLPLDHGSNFRDLGGYPAADGKHVRWGVLFRSGATPLLSDADLAQIQALALKNMVDLRSSEERVIAPTKIGGVPYTAVGYSMAAMMSRINTPNGSANNGGLYRGLPTMFAPQVQIVFQMLLRGDVPVVYNCSAGQDRTGFMSAVILSALGVPHDVILADYQLSTQVRHPEFELPKISPAVAADNPVAAYFANLQKDPRMLTPQPLYDAEHRPLLESAFDEIRERWGSVERYLAAEAGVSETDIAKLRQQYLE